MSSSADQTFVTKAPVFFVLSGPSGVGKDAVLDRLHDSGLPLHVVVTATTRTSRAGERDGIDYRFVSRQQFQRLIDQGGLLEHAEVYGQMYGVPRDTVRDGLTRGMNVAVRTDVQGAATIRAKVPHVVLVFLAPPSIDTLRQRLSDRGTDAPETVVRRLDEAAREMARIPQFDYVIVNEDGKLDECVETLSSILTAEQHRVSPRTYDI